MYVVKNILFPVDLSLTSEKLAPFAKAMAERFEARLHLLFVARVFEYFKSIYVPHPSINKFEAEIVEGARRRIVEFKESFFDHLPETRTEVVAGDIADEIIRYIGGHDIDLVVMGTHGRKGLERTIFGSVAERVIKIIPVPVLMVNPYRAVAKLTR